MPCYVRLMHKEDITQVADIDHEAFPAMWPPANYGDELRNRLAHYIVACDEGKTMAEFGLEAALEKGISGLASKIRRLFNHNRFFGNEPYSSDRQYISGFAGFRLIAEEAHLTNIAVREAYRQQGIGELRLISVIDLAAGLNAGIITLEVRVSNTAAQNLYRKYGFTQTGLRRGYYLDNREDAVIMSTENIASASFQAQLNRLKQAHSKKWGIPLYQVIR